MDERYVRPFSGKVGSELDYLYLPLAGLSRSMLLTYNACLCSRTHYEVPTPEESEACASVHLGKFLSEAKPKLIVTLGASASCLFPEVNNLHLQHGIPVNSSWGAWRGVVFPTYHPALAMSSTGFMIAMTSDFAALGKFVKETGLLEEAYGNANRD
jgi:uracil-DNA glycosylase family 4